MKRAITILAVSLASLSGAAAEDFKLPPSFVGRPGDTASLYAVKCGRYDYSIPPREEKENRMWCLGYLGGLAAALRVTKKVCIPDRIWGMDLTNDFYGVDYINSRPEFASQPGEVVLVDLLMKTWPCK